MPYPEYWRCPNCRKEVRDNSSCEQCGYSHPKGFPKEWNCRYCGTVNKDKTYCTKCFYPKRLRYPKLWHCPRCGKLNYKIGSCSCGYSGIDIKAKRVIQDQKSNILLIVLAVIIPLLLLGFIVLGISFAEPTQSFSNFSSNNAFFVYPSWQELESSNVLLRLYDSESGQELIYINSLKKFNNLDSEKNRLFSEMNGVRIHDDFMMREWDVSCFTASGDLNGCLAARFCSNNVTYMYISSTEGEVNLDIFKGVLEGFTCQ